MPAARGPRRGSRDRLRERRSRVGALGDGWGLSIGRRGRGTQGDNTRDMGVKGLVWLEIWIFVRAVAREIDQR